MTVAIRTITVIGGNGLLTTLDVARRVGSRKFLSSRFFVCFPSTKSYHRYVKKYPCNYCKLPVLGIFYKYHDIFELLSFHGNSARIAGLTCLGCKLKLACQYERDHYKPSKRRLMKAWLYDEDDGWNTADLPKALR